MTRIELNEIVKIFQKVYGDKFKIDQDGFNVWCDCLSDLRHDVAIKAAHEYVRKSQFPPTVADLRNEYNALWDEYKAMLRHVTENFESAAGVYPNITDEQRANGRRLFMMAVGAVQGNEQRERLSESISNRIKDYVREVEAGTDNTIIPFDKCVEEMIKT